MQTQRGIAVRYFAGAAIANAITLVGSGATQEFVGKAVTYGTDAEEVIEGMAANAIDFAGVIATVDAEATITRTTAAVNQGARNVAIGDAVGVENDQIVPVMVSGAVDYKDWLTLDDNGKFQKLTLSATPTAEEVLKICGRVQSAGTDGAGVVKAMIWVRK